MKLLIAVLLSVSIQSHADEVWGYDKYTVPAQTLEPIPELAPLPMPAPIQSDTDWSIQLKAMDLELAPRRD